MSGQGQLAGEEELAMVSSAAVAVAQAGGQETGPRTGYGGVGVGAEAKGLCWVVVSAAPGEGEGSA